MAGGAPGGDRQPPKRHASAAARKTGHHCGRRGEQRLGMNPPFIGCAPPTPAQSNGPPARQEGNFPAARLTLI